MVYTHLMGLVGREVDLHMDTVDRVIDHHTTPIGRVVNVPDGRTIDQQSKIIGRWIDQPNNRLRVGHIGSWFDHPYLVDLTEQIW